MNDPAMEMRHAQHMVMRVLLQSLWEEVLNQRPNPAQAHQDISRRLLSALDETADHSSLSETFRHTALHEMETFWRGVRVDR